MKIKEIPFESFPFHDKLASYNMGKFFPAVYKYEAGGYGIRIITGKSYNYNTGSTVSSWDYFELDESGLVLSSPRGMASRFNKKIRFLDMDKAVEEYKDKAL